VRTIVYCVLVGAITLLAGCGFAGPTTPQPHPQATDFFSTATVGGCTPTPAPSVPDAPVFDPPTPTPLAVAGPPGPSQRMREFVATSIVRSGREVSLVTPPPNTIDVTGLQVSFGEWCRGGFFAGCNRHGFLWTVVDGRLRVDDVSSTIVGCNPDLTAQDSWIAQFFSAAPTVRVTRDEVILESGDTVIRLVEAGS
jgi:hypothetical protein